MPQPREITDVAIDCAIHQMPEPKNGWRAKVPAVDLGHAVDEGSAQITLQAAVALLEYGEERTGNRDRAIAIANTVANINPTRFFLAEPWSHIYGTAILSIWAGYVLVATRHGLLELAARFRDLLERFAGTAALMEARLTAAGPTATKWVRRAVGSMMLLPAGCRSWGHDPTLGFSDLWNIMRGTTEPPAKGSRGYGVPGSYDDWGWQARCWRLALDILRAAAAPYVGKSYRELLPIIKRWAARTEMQLVGYADGSRLWILGDDEIERDDEDPNGNTPAISICGILGGRLVSKPEWPSPANKLDHLRQLNVVADVDGTPAKGFSLWNSHLGDRKFSGGGFVSDVPPYLSSEVVFWILIPEGSLEWIDLLAGGVPLGAPAKPPEKNVTPPAPVTPQGPKHRPASKNLLQRLFGWLF